MSCIDDHHCSIAENVTEPQCQDSYHCVLPFNGGTVITDSIADCEKTDLAKCSQDCAGCENQAGCVTNGVCVGEEPLWFVDGQIGACAFPKNRNPVRISGCLSNEKTFHKYCLDYDFSDLDQCEEANGTWINPSLTQMECESNYGIRNTCYYILMY
jgi:hypothetical protein